MKNITDKGFMLAETLIVTAFVSAVLIFLFIQFTNLSKAYDESYIYNTVENLYALEDVRDYILSDTKVLEYIDSNIDDLEYIDISDCTLVTNTSYCTNLLNLENIDKIFIAKNLIAKENIKDYEESFLTFIKKINEEGEQPYRLVASFKNNSYATIRFGE